MLECEARLLSFVFPGRRVICGETTPTVGASQEGTAPVVAHKRSDEGCVVGNPLNTCAQSHMFPVLSFCRRFLLCSSTSRTVICKLPLTAVQFSHGVSGWLMTDVLYRQISMVSFQGMSRILENSGLWSRICVPLYVPRFCLVMSPLVCNGGMSSCHIQKVC